LVSAKYPAETDAEYIAVSGFVFLRFFAPAVLGPRLFGLWDGGKVYPSISFIDG
jgi:RAS protein activator-like 1